MNSKNLKKICDNLIETFLLAGDRSIELRNIGLKKEIKADNTPVTNGDLEVNDILTAKIKSITPNIPIVSEESNSNKLNKNLNQFATAFIQREDVLNKQAKERALEMLEYFNLIDKRKSKARELSGGMKRRVQIAKAFIHDPPLIILDEPTAGVDIELNFNKIEITFIENTPYFKGYKVCVSSDTRSCLATAIKE